MRNGALIRTLGRTLTRPQLTSSKILNPSLNYSSAVPKESSLRSDLESALGVKNVSSGESIVQHHGQDHGPYQGVPPDLVTWPRSVDEVSEVCKICYSHNSPIIPYGTGTGLEGGIAAINGGVCVNLSLMEDLECHVSDFSARVQPGVTREGLNQAVKTDGLWFPIDPGANASICGMAATGASGTNAVRYGTMKENVLNLEVVLADGRVMQTSGLGTRSSKNSAGYNLTGLMVGSEGTLGIITSATVKLHALPEAVTAAVVSFPNVQAAVDVVVSVLQCSVPVARIELLDEVQMAACNRYSNLDFADLPTLFIEFHGSESELRNQSELVKDIAGEHGGGEFHWAERPEDRTKLWTARHNAYFANIALIPGCRGIATDVCVPISNLPEAIARTKTAISEHGLVGPIVGHVGDGNFHSHLLFDPNNLDQFKACKTVANEIAKVAMDLGGTCTGEHGVGQGKIGLVEEQFGEVGIEVKRSIKRALDPTGLMNPGKVIKL